MKKGENEFSLYNRLAMISVTSFLLVVVIFSLMVAGFSPFVKGFGVDEHGNVYVGEGREIRIYKNSEKIGSIRLSDSVFEMTMDENNELLVAYKSILERLDTEGNLLSSEEINDYSKYKSKTRFTAENGDVYKLVSPLGWTRIVKNSTEVVYLMHPVAVLVKVFLYCLFLFEFYHIPRIVAESYIQRRKSQAR